MFLSECAMNWTAPCQAQTSGQRRLRITLRQLEVFVAVARERSTRAAADSVSRSQSAASSALLELETTMGHPLFDRVGKRLFLNEYGQRLLPEAFALLEQAAELEIKLNHHIGMPLSIAASMTIGERILPEILTHWRNQHPSSPVRMLIMNTSGVLDAVSNLDADIGFIEGSQTRSGLTGINWFSDEMVVLCGTQCPLAKQSVCMEDLRAASWALREVGSGTREASERWLTDSLGSINIDFEFGTPQAIISLVAASNVIACLPKHAVEAHVASGDLYVLATPLLPAQRRLSIVTHGSKKPGPTSQAFIEHCLALVEFRDSDS